MKKTAGRVSVAIAGVAVLGVAALLAVAFVPTLFGARSMIVTSGSMGKAMPVGSVAVTRMVDARAIAVGDVISFRHPSTPNTVTHRVVAIHNDGGVIVFTTKGDANPAPDPEPVRVSGTIDRLEHVVPFAGYVVRYARSPYGVVLFVLVPLAGLVYERKRDAAAKARAATPPEPAPQPATTPSPVVAAVIGAVAGGLAAGALLRATGRAARSRRLTGG